MHKEKETRKNNLEKETKKNRNGRKLIISTK